ncbi:AI-2E family transporter [Candidatus Woesearchaeota archaeon]|nr:AI-2E family transporter [Candidatus Woesearchaeota archaeon]
MKKGGNSKRGNNIVDIKRFRAYLLIALAVLIFYLSYRLILPYLIPILTSIIIAFAVFPIYEKMQKKIRNRHLCAVILIIVILLGVGIPAGYMIKNLTKETFVTYMTVKQKLYAGELFPTACEKSVYCDFSQKINAFLKEPKTRYYIQLAGDKIQEYLLNYGGSFIFKLPGRIIDLFIFIIMLFFFLIDGRKLMAFVKELLPLDKKHQDRLYNQTKDTIYAVLYGHFLTAFVQGIAGGLIFYFLGISNPIFWGAAMVLFAIIPIGTWVVWAPAAISLIFVGIASGNSVFIWKGVILFILGIGFISLIDNIIKPYFIGAKTKIHMGIIILGLFGGLVWFGLIGIFLGPLILMLMLATVNIYKEMKDQAEAQEKKKHKKK